MFRLTRVDLCPRLSAKNFPFMAAGFVIVAFLLQTLMFSKSRRSDSNRLPLLITSDKSGVARDSTGLQFPHI